MLAMLRERLQKERLSNVTPVQGAVDDPRLPMDSLDLILMVDVYHEFSEPQKMLRGLKAALKPGGRLVLLEYKKEDPSIPIRIEHKMTVAEARLDLSGGTVFCSLEPCSVRLSGKRPCVEHLLAAGIRRVVYALAEPLLFVRCDGRAVLEAGGIEVVHLSEFGDAVRAINSHLFEGRDERPDPR